MSNIKENGYIAWEYADINVNRNHAPLYKDCYQNFGWTLIEQCDMHYAPDMQIYNVPVNYSTSTPTAGHDHEMVKLKFKRDSRLPNKIQLEQLQHKCDGALSSIQRLENTKSASFMGPIIGFGGVGALFVGLSIFNFVSANILLCVLFAIISLVGWFAAYYVFAKVQPSKNAQITPRIQEQFEIIYQTCEHANALLV